MNQEKNAESIIKKLKKEIGKALTKNFPGREVEHGKPFISKWENEFGEFEVISNDGFKVCLKVKPNVPIEFVDLNFMVTSSGISQTSKKTGAMKSYLIGKNVITYDWNDQQMSELCGPYSTELYDKIKEKSTDQTEWKGFPKI